MHRRRLVATLVLSSVVLAAASALADSSSVSVSLASAPGTRQFYVEDLTGAELTALDLGTGGNQPFRVRVKDTAFASPTAGYQVSATMTNLYRQSGAGYDYGVRIPSSAVSLDFPSSALQANGVSLAMLPTLDLSGTVPSCSSLVAANPTALAGLLLDPLAAPLCALLGSSGKAVSGISVPAAATTITPLLAQLTDLPVQLGGTDSGPFTNADYANGVGAGDTAGATGAPAATARRVMQGTPGLSAALLAQITSAIEAALAGLPLTSGTGASAKASLSGVLGALQSSTNTTTASLGSTLGALGSATQQAAIVNALTAALRTPSIADIQSLTGSYYAFPVLRAAPAAPAAGAYRGTLTVTFVQS